MPPSGLCENTIRYLITEKSRNYPDFLLDFRQAECYCWQNPATKKVQPDSGNPVFPDISVSEVFPRIDAGLF
jgi:hypothetical protein